MASDDLQNLLKSGVQAARSGNKMVARNIFEEVIKRDSQNEMAWMWFASVVDTPAERQQALQRVLAINPNNERAKQALDKLRTASMPKVESDPPPAARSAPPPTPAPAAPPAAEESRTLGVREEMLAQSLEERRQQQRGLNPVVYFLVAIVALVSIGAGVFLLVQELQDDDGTDEVAEPPQVLATFTPEPSPTRAPATVNPGSIDRPQLGPTWTPSPTHTLIPSPTATLPPFNLANFTLAFAGAENPTALRQIQFVAADGENLETLNLTLNPEVLEIVTPTPEATVVQEGVAAEDVVDDAEEEATPTLEPTEEPTPEETPDATPDDADDDDADGEAPVELYENLEFLDPAYSPDGQFLAFTAQLDEEVQEIMIVRLPSGTPRQLTALGGSITDGAAWSADGEEIAFASNADGDFDIYVVDVNGDDDPINLTDSSAQERDPVFSPDGSQLVFSSDQATPGELEIWSLPRQGSGDLRQLTDAQNSSFAPTFSPDGERIAFISDRGGDNDLYIMRADGSDERLVSTNDQDWQEFDPAWSPDGEWIAVSTDREDSRVLHIWLAKPDGSDWRQVTEGNGNSRGASWFPELPQ